MSPTSCAYLQFQSRDNASAYYNSKKASDLLMNGHRSYNAIFCTNGSARSQYCTNHRSAGSQPATFSRDSINIHMEKCYGRGRFLTSKVN
ncbi:hypothetical protein VTP01DRAFT_131 [Rhizomucor pusillus]|uniref:uncharacterized protein n=1 Tax=Rhizomucor pusillus TaxID=4840 RepID=UPI003742500C